MNFTQCLTLFERARQHLQNLRSVAIQMIFHKEAFEADSPEMAERLKLGESSRLSPNFE